jgi:putative hydrolase of the HAD superfamily
VLVTEVKALFWDVGGVILSNGWDSSERAAAIRRFGLDAADFEQRHAAEFPALEMGRITLDTYLDRTVFYSARFDSPRPFSREEFTDFVFSQSTAKPETLTVLEGLAATHHYFMATLNNESAELNAYRIRTFQLTRFFSAFFSSCYLGVRKPEEQIYRLALEITQRVPEECIFIDDRPENLEVPKRLGMRTIQFVNAAQLRADLAGRNLNVEAGAGASNN